MLVANATMLPNKVTPQITQAQYDELDKLSMRPIHLLSLWYLSGLIQIKKKLEDETHVLTRKDNLIVCCSLHIQ